MLGAFVRHYNLNQIVVETAKRIGRKLAEILVIMYYNRAYQPLRNWNSNPHFDANRGPQPVSGFSFFPDRQSPGVRRYDISKNTQSFNGINGYPPPE
jgi:hypothetical protein